MKVKTLELTNGEKVKVIKEEGIFYVCEGRQFRKGSPNIANIIEESVSSSKKKKKAEEPESEEPTIEEVEDAKEDTEKGGE